MSHRFSPHRLVIATRESRLALWQARHVQQLIEQHDPNCTVELLGMTTRGDQILDRPLAKIGGKGLFVKELEVALWERRADLAVHSMKDVPMVLGEPFRLAAVLPRETPVDAFVSNRYASLDELPPGAIVGTSSLRRQAQLIAQYPYLSVEPLRGNLDTRLRKLDEGQYDAVVLAAAGLKRLGLAERIRAELPVSLMLPAAGQGALAVEILAERNELAEWFAFLHDAATAACVAAERAFARRLGGSCEVPIAAYATIEGGSLWLRGLVAEPDGSAIYRGEIRGAVAAAETLGVALAEQLIAEGAEELVARLSFPQAGGLSRA